GKLSYDFLLDGVRIAANVPYMGTAAAFDGLMIQNTGDSDNPTASLLAQTGASNWDEISVAPLANTGTFRSPLIDFSNHPVGTNRWGTLTWQRTVPSSSALSLQVEFFNGSSWALIPNADLAGNSTGFTSGSVDLRALSTTTYSALRLVATFARGNDF